jgi:MEMO1 family protein
MSTRKAVVSGSFYPDKKEEILKYINHFNSFKTNDETFEI